jgi:hypothetical protein
VQKEQDKLHSEALKENHRREKEKLKAGLASGMHTGSQMAGLKAAHEARRKDVMARWAARAKRQEHVSITQDRFRQRAEISNIPSDLLNSKSTITKLQNLRNQYVSGKMRLKQYNSELATFNYNLRAQARAAQQSKMSMRDLRSELIQATAAFTAFSVVKSIAVDSMRMEGLTAAARVFAKDDAGVAEHMSFVADEADRLGVNLMTATEQFTKFSIGTKSTLDKATQRSVFSGVSEYAAVLQLDQQQYERTFRSVIQMSDKGLYA